MKRLLAILALLLLKLCGVISQSAFAQPVIDDELHAAMDACAAHQQKFSVGEAPAAYEAGWEHCEILREEFLRRRAGVHSSDSGLIERAAA